MNATADTTTTHGDLTFVSNDRRTIVYRDGHGVLGRIEANGRAFSATLYTTGGGSINRLFSTHRHALAAFKYGF